MIKIEFIKDFWVENEFYTKGDTLPEGTSIETIVKLNEKGAIKPLSTKDIMELSKPKKSKGEEI